MIVYHAIALWVPGLGGLCAYLRLRPRLLQPSRAGYQTSPTTGATPLLEGDIG